MGVAADAREGEPPSVAERRPGQPLPVAELPRVFGSLEERLVRCPELAPPRPRLAETEQEIATHRLVTGSGELERVQAECVEAACLLVGEQSDGPVTGPPGVIGRLAGFPARCGEEEMVSELCEMRPWIGRVKSLERLGGEAVERDPPRARQLLVESVADQGVREAEPPGRAGHLADDPCRHRLVEPFERLAGRQAAHRLEGAEAELAAEHACERQDSSAVLRQAAQPPPNHLANALRNAELLDGLPTSFLQFLLCQEADDLTHEEWVALGLLVNPGDKLLGRRHFRSELDQARHVLLAESGQR